MNDELSRYEAIVAGDSLNPGGDSELVEAARQILALDRDEGFGAGHLDRLYALRVKISHTPAHGPAGLRAKAIAARTHSNGFSSTHPEDEGGDVDDVAFSLAGDLLGLPHNRRLAA